MNTINYRNIAMISLIFMLSSCLKDTINELSDINGIQVSPQFSAPLISTSIGMKEIYESYSKSALIIEDPNNLLVFVFQNQDTVAPPDVLSFSPVPFSYALQMDAPTIALFEANGGVNVSLSDSIKLNVLNGEQIKLMNVKAGKFAITVVNEFKHDLSIVITYPYILKNGVALSANINIPYDANNSPATVVKEIDLAGSDIDFSKGGTSINTVAFDYQISLTQIQSNSTLPSEVLSITQDFSIDGFNLIQGYLGKFAILNKHQITDIDLFSNSTTGQILINDPRLSIKLNNTFGLPVTGRITNLRVIDQNNISVPVTINPFQDTFSFKEPITPGQLATSEFNINKTNSNIDVAINSKPKHLEFDIQLFANYLEIVSDNFLLDTSLFAVDMDTEIPFDLKMIDYTTINKEKNSSFTALPSTVKDVLLTVITENTLPFDITAQMLFTRDSIALNGDTINIPIDSLFDPPLAIQGGVVDANGIVLIPGKSIQQVRLPLEKYARIQSAPFNLLSIGVNSSQFNGAPGFVKIFSSQRLNMKIGGDIKLTYKSKE